MPAKQKITVSIVLYNENQFEIDKALKSCLDCLLVSRIFVIDNSSKSKFNLNYNDHRISYKKTDKNLGFGRGHNLILNEIKKDSDFHLVLNSDVWFDPKILENLISALNKDSNIALIAPKLMFPNGNEQISSRKHPRFWSLLFKFLKIKKSRNYFGNQLNDSQDLYATEFLHGAFLLFRTTNFLEIKGFDKRYFLYMEDADICRKLLLLKKDIAYCPELEAYHVLKRESRKSLKLFVHHTISSFKYFLKWGF